MGELMRDPELDRLVQEMNRQGDEESPAGGEQPHDLVDAPHLCRVRSGEPLQAVLATMVEAGASDLVLVAGSPPMLRVDGRLRATDAPAVDGEEIRGLFAPHLGARAQDNLAREGSADFSLRLASGAGSETSGWRLRVNVHRQRGELSAAVRSLPRRIPSFAELNLPGSLEKLVESHQGLVLVCGPTGVGKSTTLAALLDTINRGSSRHVMTIEEPVEYEHDNLQSIVEQVEVGSDAPSFAHALRTALRCDPDVILVGEMRDLETIATALTAAETGHLILSTLHTSNVAQAVHRMIDVFPSTQQEQIRHQLALSLSAIVCQQLVPLANGNGRVPALEVLLATYAVRNHIRKGNLHQLYNEIQVHKGLGMCSMEQSLVELAKSGKIATEEARCRATRPDELERLLAG